MANRARVPKFGQWESEQPYTVFFDKARKDRNGKMINPNDPQENPDMFPSAAVPPPIQAPPSKFRPPVPEAIIKPAHERRASRESADVRLYTESSGRSNMGAPTGNGGRQTASGRPSRQSVGSEHSVENSPLHQHYPARGAPKSSAPAALEGRSRMKQGNDANPSRGVLQPSRGAAVPKFGDWDEKNPSSADGYTHIFNKVREERYTPPPANVSNTESRPPYSNLQQRQKHASDTMKCCFL